MATETMVDLEAQVATAAAAAGLMVAETAAGVDFTGAATLKFTLARTGAAEKTHLLEVSAGTDLERAPVAAEFRQFLGEWAQRLRNPVPDAYVSLSGLPLRAEGFAWPFHRSTSGADTMLVHGQVRLLDGAGDTPLHAKIAASMTVTFQEILPALEQPFAEGMIVNAVRKTLDQGQLELVKSGNRQPVPVTTRYYSTKQKHFVFNDTTPEQRREYLTAKVFWLSGVLGGGAAVWAGDPRDAQYLNTTLADLEQDLRAVEASGLVQVADGFASASAALMGMREHYEAEVADALAFIKPTFNEDMRSGLTNM